MAEPVEIVLERVISRSGVVFKHEILARFLEHLEESVAGTLEGFARDFVEESMAGFRKGFVADFWDESLVEQKNLWRRLVVDGLFRDLSVSF